MKVVTWYHLCVSFLAVVHRLCGHFILTLSIWSGKYYLYYCCIYRMFCVFVIFVVCPAFVIFDLL
jgi:hypothetical protein